MRRNIGLYVYTNGRSVTSGSTWAEFVERVAAAAKPKSNRPGNTATLSHAGDASSLWGEPIPADRRCTFTHRKGDNAGKRCGNWAMKGAKRCRAHGGYRQNPEHPATARRLADVLAVDLTRKARATLRDADPRARSAVEQALTEIQIPRRPETVLQGIEALQADDGGRAWRRFLQQAKAACPSQGMQARRGKQHNTTT